MNNRRFGSYRIVRRIGEGAMGEVFEAVHEQIRRRAAVKVLHPQLSHNAEIARRFLNEARAVNIVRHPGIVDIFEFGQTQDGTAYLVMEFLEGESLHARMARMGRHFGPEGLRLCRQIATAVAAAHGKGIVHRDLKPANVMIVPDSEVPGGERVKVLDFGVAKVAAALTDSLRETPGTDADLLMGTPTYMAPEQCQGAALVNDRADVYSLGVMLYQVLSGRTPFVNADIAEMIALQVSAQPPPLCQLAPSVPRDLADFVHLMLHKTPSARPSMSRVVGELEWLGMDQVTEHMPLISISIESTEIMCQDAAQDPSTVLPVRPSDCRRGPSAERASTRPRRHGFRVAALSASLAAVFLAGPDRAAQFHEPMDLATCSAQQAVRSHPASMSTQALCEGATPRAGEQVPWLYL